MSFFLFFNVVSILSGSFLATSATNGNETDRLALRAIQAKINGDPFGVFHSWNDSLHFCLWHGVTCGRRHQRVTTLDLRAFELSGSISPHVGNLSFLRELYLQNNSFSQSIPPQIGRLRRLQRLVLNSNKLFGSLPPTLGQLKSLVLMDISGNLFSGIIPPSLFNLSSIEVLDIGYNQLQGSLPSELGSRFQKIHSLSISTNQFTGSIPVSISNLSNIRLLQLGFNRLTGKVPTLENLQKLKGFAVSNNSLGGGQDGDLDFLSSLTNVTTLQLLGIENNNFGGKLPENICNLSRNLRGLFFDNNQIHGSIPNGIDSLINLQIFQVTGNKLSGNIPSSIGKLQNLRVLYLFTNYFSGFIPSSLGNLTNLINLSLRENNLHGSIPSSIGKCLKLMGLELSYNNLSGTIPPQVMSLSSLTTILDLSNNHHLSGEIPNEVENLKNLDILDVSNNMLSGQIPGSVGRCISLEFLILDGNLFNGSIPSSFTSLMGLRELDLSRNNFSGNIPGFLQNFKLEKLNLSYNSFQGEVPTRGVFKNANKTSLVGNSKLCDGIPEFQLPKCNFDKPKKGTKKTLIISLSSIAVGLTIAFSCLLVNLTRRKRRKENASNFYDNQLIQVSYHSLVKATNEFSSANLIGRGSFGSVYKGILDQGGRVITIAVKVFNLHRRGSSKSFIVECEALRNIRHKNLVKIVTACSSIDGQGNDFKALVYEFMSGGSLEEWLHATLTPNEEPRTLNLLQRIDIATDIGNAIEYLHHRCERPIVHCDLKPSNILLDDDMTGHVSDFGIAKFFSEEALDCPTNESSSATLRGTIGYAPPEYGAGSRVTTYGDIYSYGILLLEMFTGKRPTDGIFIEEKNLHNFVKMALLPEEVINVVDPVLRSTGNTTQDNIVIECLISILEIGVSCSVEQPRERMNIMDAVSRLRTMKNKLVKAQVH